MVVDVLFCELSPGANWAEEGSSTSFSEICRLRRLVGTGMGGRSLDRDVILLLEPALVAERAASGLELHEGPAELSDACAVLAESEAVGGPEEKMDLEGVLNSEDCWVTSELGGETGR
jgi:hypothetical protein